MTRVCEATMREILHTEICGTAQVRNELIVTQLGIAASNIIECASSDFIDGECSMPCDDKIQGGHMTMTREAVVANGDYGAACPALSISKKCGQFKIIHVRESRHKKPARIAL
jgi:hypothetical protein